MIPVTRQNSVAQKVIEPGFRWVLTLVFVLFALTFVNSAYLLSITLLEYYSGQVYQDYTYLLMFLLHLILGLALLLPFLAFAWMHIRRAIHRDNRYAISAGIALFITGLVLLVSGIVLTRFGFFEIDDPRIREPLYWLHVITPLVLIWLYILHRLAGRTISYRPAWRWLAVTAVFVGVMLGVHLNEVKDPANTLARNLSPALAQVSGGELIPAEHLMNNEECDECHGDIVETWKNSMHRHSSFTNPAYRFSVEETRKVVLKRDGDVTASRFCAGCHDIVPLFSGRFDLADFDPDSDSTAMAGLTCTSCHAISAVNSTRGTGDYTITDPPRYPFAFSDSELLKSVNHQLIKAKPEFHKKTFLKPVLTTAEFCSVCHKTHLPYQVNHYKWLPGQNHYDSFLQSGVSGHKVSSFYYPPKAKIKCAECHMPLLVSDDPAARDFDGSGERKIHSHLFPGANTAVPEMLNLPPAVIEAQQERLDKIARIDLFALKPGDTDGELIAPLDQARPELLPGGSYQIESVIRTTGVGHHLTQGTADSNELWLDVAVYDGDRLIGRSGGRDDKGEVDPWSYFVNAYVLDRNGKRIDRRNAQDIFVPLYNHQIPPGAADVVHFHLTLPDDVTGPIRIEARLNYRKFDNTYMHYIKGDKFVDNRLPVTVLATDSIALPVAGGAPAGDETPSSVETWERWNDYGIALLREGNQGSSKGELRQAEAVFQQVETMNPGMGALNLARAYYKEGDVEDAAEALRRAAREGSSAWPWTVAWFSALIDHENGHLDQALASLERIYENRFSDARAKGFDFSRDLNLLNELGRTSFERARQMRGDAQKPQRVAQLQKSCDWFNKTLAIDPENRTAHYNLALVYGELGDQQKSAYHRALHEKYRPDDNAIEVAVTRHRRENPAADHAASAFPIYDLNRAQAFGLPADIRVAMKQPPQEQHED
jgi:tetratricopeptide (TPR) repeat protein